MSIAFNIVIGYTYIKLRGKTMTHPTKNCPACDGLGVVTENTAHGGFYKGERCDCSECDGTGYATCVECGSTNVERGMMEFGWKLEGLRGDLICFDCWEAEMDANKGFVFKVFSAPITKKTFAAFGKVA